MKVASVKEPSIISISETENPTLSSGDILVQHILRIDHMEKDLFHNILDTLFHYHVYTSDKNNMERDDE